MRGLPFFLARGPLLAELVRNCAQDTRRHRLCDCCGARMVFASARPDRLARCSACLRQYGGMEPKDTPWRLTAASAEALRRTKSWVRWV